MSTPRSIIVTASDAAYFGVLGDLLASLDRPAVRAAFDIGVVDAGLRPDQRALIERKGVIVSPMLDPYDFPGKADWLAKKPGLLATLERPMLPRHFPGYDVYLHLDADTWVQDHRSLDVLRDLAADGRMAIVPEIDRSYRNRDGRIICGMDDSEILGALFGERIATRMGRRPRFNAGVFALASDSDIWERWRARLESGLANVTDFEGRVKLFEQCALNVVLQSEPAPAALLPATWNWFVLFARPFWDPARMRLVEPQPPHDPIRILHLSHAYVGTPAEIRVLGENRRIRMELGFRSVRAMARRTGATPAAARRRSARRSGGSAPADGGRRS